MAISSRPEPTAVALHDPMGTTLGQMIAPFRAQLEPFLTGGVTLERVAAELHLAGRKTPGLDRCRPETLVDAVCKALGTGGTIGTDVYLVPFKGEVTVMLDYKFKAELVVQAGGARSIDARPVYEGDHFAVRYGSAPGIDHTPGPMAKRGKLIGAYACAFLGFNHLPKIAWLTIDEVEVTRGKSQQWGPSKVKDCPPWYACKCAVHQVVKLLPKNPKLRTVTDQIEREEQTEFGAATSRIVDGVDMSTGEDVTYHGEQAGEDHPVGDPIDPPVAVDQDVAWAMDYRVPGGPKSVAGHGGKVLGHLSVSAVREVQEWALRQTEQVDGWKKAPELEQACAVVLEVRAK